MNIKHIFCFAFTFMVLNSTIKVTHANSLQEAYLRADSAANFNDLVYGWNVQANWIDSSATFWYTVKTQKGIEYKWVDSKKAKVTAAFDHVKLSRSLSQKLNKTFDPYKLNLEKLKFENNSKTITFELDGKRWVCDLKKYELTEKGDAFKPQQWPHWATVREEADGEPVESPNGNYSAYIKDFNLFVRNIESNTETQLSFDGADADYYSSNILWSPDSKHIAVNKIRRHIKQFMQFIESSPDEQLRPILKTFEYLRPGDVVPIKRPNLFNIETKQQIPVETRFYEHQYSLSNPKWWIGSEAFTFEFNQRGHQRYQVVEVDAATGITRAIIDEHSETFIDYSGKRFRQDIEDTKEIIWMSERDGWNHLYLVDGNSGLVKNMITKGEWVVRKVVHVDEENRCIIFEGSGKNEGEDPYNIHYYRVNFDGTELTDLTPEAMNHHAVFCNNYEFFVNTYSTPINPPVSVLRSAYDGAVVMQLESADISELLAAGWKQPDVFVAKARDGETDIWGNIYYPSNFDPGKQYPIIEYIYAGPHAAYVEKNFMPYSSRFSGLAELGFIIVQIDGMGTSYRSKAFHDICFQNLKDSGFPDRILWMKAAANERPFMDISRVGVFGGSAGGQNSTAALLFHPDFYKVAVSSCGCHDNRMDKMWWNEQWMGYPVGKHYEESSNIVNAHKLEGNLMLIVGEIDDNVDPASTMQMANALIRADKEFELVVLPGVNHTLGGKYGERKRRDFFVRHLYGKTPPQWNK